MNQSSSSSSSLMVLLVITLSLSLFQSQSLVVRIPPGKVKCVTEDVDPTAMSLATYRLAADPPHPYNMSARVTDPNGEVIHLENNVASGQFAFVAAAPGRYSACFWSPLFRIDGHIDVDFEWRTGIAAPGFGQVAKKGKINAVESDLKKLEDSINSIHMEMRFLREREEESWKINEDTKSRMGMLSLLSLAICLGVAGLQIWHLKSFFEREKIL